MSRAAPERYVWAVEILDIQPDDVILEIGCGYGHSIPLICEKLTTGRLTAIDRSGKMVIAAREASLNQADAGKLKVLHSDLLAAGLPSSHFDKIFLYNLNVFWMDPKDELAEIRRLMRTNGRFYLFHQPPPGHELAEFETAFLHNLQANGFKVDAVRYSTHESSIALIAI